MRGEGVAGTDPAPLAFPALDGDLPQSNPGSRLSASPILTLCPWLLPSLSQASLRTLSLYLSTHHLHFLPPACPLPPTSPASPCHCRSETPELYLPHSGSSPSSPAPNTGVPGPYPGHPLLTLFLKKCIAPSDSSQKWGDDSSGFVSFPEGLPGCRQTLWTPSSHPGGPPPQFRMLPSLHLGLPSQDGT